MARNPEMDAAVGQTTEGYSTGDQVSYRGYDIVAYATALVGGGNPYCQVVTVLNNNSTHYLVCAGESANDLPHQEGFFLYSFRYESDDECSEAYKNALQFMLAYALSH